MRRHGILIVLGLFCVGGRPDLAFGFERAEFLQVLAAVPIETGLGEIRSWSPGEQARQSTSAIVLHRFLENIESPAHVRAA